MISQSKLRVIGKLPARYSRQSEVSYQVKFQQWVTVTEMSTTTEGQSSAYFLSEDGEAIEITRDEYKKHILASIGK